MNKNQFPVVKCPYCFRSFTFNNVVFRCLPTSRDRALDNYLLSYHVARGNDSYKKMTPFFVDPADLKRAQIETDEQNRIVAVANPDTSSSQPLTQRLCPYCHNDLLSSFGKNETRYIAVVGVPNSGKTTFLAATNSQLKNTRSLAWSSLDSEKSKPLDDVTLLYGANNTEARTATKSIQGPYFYRLSRRGVPAEEAIHVVFFDIPGEFYTSAENMKNHQLIDYLSNADGIIFIVNAAEPIEHEAAIAAGGVKKLVDTLNILDAFAETGIMKKKKTAIVFNKLDKVRNELGIKDLSLFLSDPMNGADIDKTLVDAKSAAIESLLLLKGASAGKITPLHEKLQLFMEAISDTFGQENSRLFATRLLTEDDDGSFTFTPQCSEVPLIWLLSEIGGY